MALSRILCLALACCLLLMLGAGAAASAPPPPPEIKVNHFRGMPTKFVRLGDTSVLLYHDRLERSIYISSDSGKNWRIPTEIPRWHASLLIAHPVDSSVAFILTRERKHWRTNDHGETWISFETPVEPAWVANPLSFHINVKKTGYILFQGRNCETIKWTRRCLDETYYTKEGFLQDLKLLSTDTTSCIFAHSGKEFKPEASDDLIYCIAVDKSLLERYPSIRPSHILRSEDFFVTDSKVEDFGLGDNVARSVLDLSIRSKYAVASVLDLRSNYLNKGNVKLYVTTDTKQWNSVRFPIGNQGWIHLREGAYKAVDAVTHSLGIKLLDRGSNRWSDLGPLLVSSSDGNNFIESLPHINYNSAGYVEYEVVYGVEGVAVANIIHNARAVESWGAYKQLRSKITFNGGRTWEDLLPPALDIDGRQLGCDSRDQGNCTLHLHSIRTPHHLGDAFSSPAAGFVMGVGSVGNYLKPYEECDTFLSTDAGVTWRMVRRGPHVYEFGAQGGIIVMMEDDFTDVLLYSLDMGRTWSKKNLDAAIRPRALLAKLDQKSQKFLALGQTSSRDPDRNVGISSVSIDFSGLFLHKCTNSDRLRWDLRSPNGQKCVMGIEQWFWHRKLGAICYMDEQLHDVEKYPEGCPCVPEDYECDLNYAPLNGTCVQTGAEEISPDQCQSGHPDETYLGSSGYRKIPGNSCNDAKGSQLDTPQIKACMPAPPEGHVLHTTFIFPASIIRYQHFKDSLTILVLLDDKTMWQSPNGGYTWTQLGGNRLFLTFYIHPYSSAHAYLITADVVIQTTDFGKHWHILQPPTRPNTFGIPYLQFHPLQENFIIWMGMSDACLERWPLGKSCSSVAHYTVDNGRNWGHVEDYVRNCEWVHDPLNHGRILCKRYTIKGDQRTFKWNESMELVSGTDFFKHQTKLFDRVLEFTQILDRVVVAEVANSGIRLQVSMDSVTFAPALFPPNVTFDAFSFTILESFTESLYIYQNGPNTPRWPGWGTLFKSDANWTRFTSSKDYVDRNAYWGQTIFERIVGIEGTGLINVVSNPQDTTDTMQPESQTMITHNDGGSWGFLTPPKYDANGDEYKCRSPECHLHIYAGSQSWFDRSARYRSTPAVPGVLIGLGNVGKYLARNEHSSTFYSRDAGVTWETLHQDPHVWQFGDHGSLLVAANNGQLTDEVIFSENEGLSWQQYQFSDEKIYVTKILTSSDYTTRKFLLLGRSRVGLSLMVYLDFSSLTKRKCLWTKEYPATDDMELWTPSSPSPDTPNGCMGGRQTLYHRRQREASCVVGDIPLLPTSIFSSCLCTAEDFECEFNHERHNGTCVPLTRAEISSDEHFCVGGQEHWYENTTYRKIAHSVCVGGLRLDRGASHACTPNDYTGRAARFWWVVLTILLVIVGIAAVAWWYRRRIFRTDGAIHLPEEEIEDTEAATS